MAFLKFSSIKAKLSMRFGILLAIFILCVGFTFITLNKSIYINNEINNVYAPSVQKLQDVKLLISNSRLLITNWIFVQSDNKNSDKVKLNLLIEREYPESKKLMQHLSYKWASKDKKLLDSIFVETDALFADYDSVKKVLSSFESYNDAMLVFQVSPMIQEQGSITLKFNKIVNDLDKLANSQIENANLASSNMTGLLSWFKIIIIFIAIGTIILGLFTIRNTIKNLVKPINLVKNALIKMGNGELSDNVLSFADDEIGEMSKALNYLSEGLKQTAQYADKIGNGEFNASYVPLSENDMLGNSLLNMGKKLKVLSEEDKKRNWVTTGLARFADILRSNTDVVKLSEELIQNLVKYLEANQGGIFLLQEESGKRTLELSACYAYDRKKFLQKSIQEGEGLLGQCLLERDRIFLTEVPENYIHIKSGLGGSNPRSILIQPLMINETMVGAIELATFKIFDKFELEFISKLSENIAGVISNVKINERTVHLLDEAQTAQESMRAQEEELRQNLEELTATQEEIFRKEQEYLQKISDLERSGNLQVS